MTILLVEDDEVDILAVKRALEKLRIVNPLVVARDGVEALERLDGKGEGPGVKRPYLILLDLNMPRLSGIELLEELRNHPEHRDALVFVLTTSKRDEDRVAAYDKNVAGYVVKSDFQDGFRRALAMLDRYWRVVEFP